MDKSGGSMSTNDEITNLRSQFVSLNDAIQDRRYRAFVFTEHGIENLSAILTTNKKRPHSWPFSLIIFYLNYFLS